MLTYFHLWMNQEVKKKIGGTDKIVGSSCVTNEGAIDSQDDPLVKSSFLSCKPIFEEYLGYCYDSLSANNIVSFSYKTKFKFSKTSTDPLQDGMSWDNANFGKCRKYFQEAKKLWVDELKKTGYEGEKDEDVLKEKFDNDIHRIEIRKDNKKGKVVQC